METRARNGMLGNSQLEALPGDHQYFRCRCSLGQDQGGPQEDRVASWYHYYNEKERKKMKEIIIIIKKKKKKGEERMI